MISCVASNFSAIILASLDSSMLSANLTDSALILRSANDFLNRQSVNVESIPPLRAIQTFVDL